MKNLVFFLIPFGLSLIFTPLVRLLAFRSNLVSYPRADRWHKYPTALLGGVSIFLASVSSVFLLNLKDKSILGLLLGATLLFIVGLADDKFHFGYYKIENLASIAAAIVMLVLAGYIVYRSYLQFINPVYVNLPILGAIVAFIAALIAWGLGFYKYIKGKNCNLNSVKLEGINTIKDGTSSFLVVVALILDYYGYHIADAIVGFIIAGIIVSIGFAAIKESSFMLIDACDGTCVLQGDAIKNIILNISGVKSVHMVRLRRSGPVAQGEIEIKVSADMSVAEFDSIRKKILKLIKEKYPDIERLTITAIPD